MATLTNDGTGVLHVADATIASSIDITGSTEDTSPDSAADYILTYDADAAANKKVLLRRTISADAAFNHLSSPIQADGLLLRNSSAASAGNQQYSNGIYMEGQGWKTDATAASQAVNFRQLCVPIQGAAAPTGEWQLDASINGGAYSNVIKVDSAGTCTATAFVGDGSGLTGVGGGGDVSGPASSTDNVLCVFNGTGGKTIQEGGGSHAVACTLTDTGLLDAAAFRAYEGAARFVAVGARLATEVGSHISVGTHIVHNGTQYFWHEANTSSGGAIVQIRHVMNSSDSLPSAGENGTSTFEWLHAEFDSETNYIFKYFYNGGYRHQVWCDGETLDNDYRALKHVNPRAATVSLNQLSPPLILQGECWETTGGTSQEVGFRQYVNMTDGSAAFGTWTLEGRIENVASGVYQNAMEFTTDGDLKISGMPAFNGQTVPTQQTYTPTNVSTDRSYDADTVAVAELADVVGTLIADLQAIGLIA